MIIHVYTQSYTHAYVYTTSSHQRNNKRENLSIQQSSSWNLRAHLRSVMMRRLNNIIQRVQHLGAVWPPLAGEGSSLNTAAVFLHAFCPCRFS